MQKEGEIELLEPSRWNDDEGPGISSIFMFTMFCGSLNVESQDHGFRLPQKPGIGRDHMDQPACFRIPVFFLFIRGDYP